MKNPWFDIVNDGESVWFPNVVMHPALRALGWKSFGCEAAQLLDLGL